MPVGGCLGDSGPFGKGAQAEYLRAFGFQGLKTQAQEFFPQVAVVVGVIGFQWKPPDFDFVVLNTVSIL